MNLFHASKPGTLYAIDITSSSHVLTVSTSSSLATIGFLGQDHRYISVATQTQHYAGLAAVRTAGDRIGTTKCKAETATALRRRRKTAIIKP